MTIIFQFQTITIHVCPEKDICNVFRFGFPFPIWSGRKDELIEILESVHNE